MSQANTKEGDILAMAADILDCEDTLLCACDHDGELGVRYPSNEIDIPIYVLIYGGEKGSRVTVRPLYRHRSVRVVTHGMVKPGMYLFPVLDGTGRVARNAFPGVKLGRLVGIAEEYVTDGQLVRMRPV